MTVEVAVRATNAQLGAGSADVSSASSSSQRTIRAVALNADGTSALPANALSQTGRRVTVPANDRVEIRIPAAAVKAGTARFQIGAVSGRWTDAVIYLTSYPYECSEQLSSRIITIAALRDVLTAFKAKDLPSAEEMEAAV